MEESIQQPVQQPSLKRNRSIVSWILVFVLLIASLTGFTLYILAQKQVKEAQSLKATIQTKLNDKELSLKEVEEKLKTAVFLPDGSKMSPQCYSSNNDQTRLALVNSTPIDGFNVYIVNCIKDLVSGKENGKVIAFKVATDGTQTFVYGAGSFEPYCIPEKILPADAAADISKTTGLPICKTF